jgi:ATP/maltotriose-dependent transcriptional regulator MalT
VTVVDPLEQGREAFSRRAWTAACTELSAADRQRALGPADLERLAVAAYLVGRDEESADAWARAYRAYADEGDVNRAALCGFHLGMGFMNQGETARAAGWFARAERLLDESGLDCIARGYLLVPDALGSLVAGEAATAYDRFSRLTEMADRFGDPDAMAMARLGKGQALIAMGKTGDGLALLDEVMVAVTASEVSPVNVGIAYCAAILACQEVFDQRRAQEWTAALTRWCEAQPDLVPYRGQCLVHRAEIMQLHGEWSDALNEAVRACERLARRPAGGMAFYALGELHRLRGAFSDAEQAYRQAGQRGREPQPGLVLLRLAQGRRDDAKAMMRRVLGEAQDRVSRARVLPAYVELTLATGDPVAARAAANELSEIATAFGAPLLRAAAARANGQVLLAEANPNAALAELRTAWQALHQIDAPYEAARTRVLIGLACRRLGDLDSAKMEFDAARWVFQQLGAGPDLAGVENLMRPAPSGAAGGLTGREVEVLRLVAVGKTNRSIAGDLFLSDKTVARHLANIFGKLGVSTRSAATAWAYEHDVVQPHT